MTSTVLPTCHIQYLLLPAAPLSGASNLFAGLKVLIWGLVLLEIPVLGSLVDAVTAAQGHTDFAGDLVDRRLVRADHAKPDIWSFAQHHNISADRLSGLSYLRAVLMEGLRMYNTGGEGARGCRGSSRGAGRRSAVTWSPMV
ncbi:hypothetical protein LZ31DRAFT_591705 [Colletotrichum somersetense]|nr:hypothetical protein LZ31DRAFT_591705 [Colletotrichum somersetense]